MSENLKKNTSEFDQLLEQTNDIKVYLPFKEDTINVKPLCYSFFDPIIKIITKSKDFDAACYTKIYNHVINQIQTLCDVELNYFDTISVILHLLNDVKEEIVLSKDNIINCKDNLQHFLKEVENIKQFIQTPYTFIIQDTQFELHYKIPDIVFINEQNETHEHIKHEINKFVSTVTIVKGDKKASSDISTITNKILNLPANLVSNVLKGVLDYKEKINNTTNNFNPIEDIEIIMYFVDTD